LVTLAQKIHVVNSLRNHPVIFLGNTCLRGDQTLFDSIFGFFGLPFPFRYLPLKVSDDIIVFWVNFPNFKWKLWVSLMLSLSIWAIKNYAKYVAFELAKNLEISTIVQQPIHMQVFYVEKKWFCFYFSLLSKYPPSFWHKNIVSETCKKFNKVKNVFIFSFFLLLKFIKSKYVTYYVMDQKTKNNDENNVFKEKITFNSKISKLFGQICVSKFYWRFIDILKKKRCIIMYTRISV